MRWLAGYLTEKVSLKTAPNLPVSDVDATATATLHVAHVNMGAFVCVTAQ